MKNDARKNTAKKNTNSLHHLPDQSVAANVCDPEAGSPANNRRAGFRK